MSTVERLSLVPGKLNYDPILTAEHLVRYLSVKAICKGKSVLDAACGEGYGTKLLAEWGAANVVGVDYSAEAIQLAREQYSGSQIRYVVGDLQATDTEILGNEKFDIICSFETIEHLENPVAFLNKLKKWQKRAGVIVLSAPNDPAIAADHVNSFHKQRYSFEDLKLLVEPVLGKASGWYMGTAAHGICLRNMAASPVETHAENLANLSFDKSSLAWIPPSAATRASEINCSFWMGVWGLADVESLVAAPLAMTSFVEPWKALDSLKSELRRINLTLAEERRVALNDRKLMSELNTVLDDEIQRRGIKFDKGLALSDKARQILAQGVLSRLFNSAKTVILRMGGR